MKRYGSEGLAQELKAKTRIPVIVGPMFLVSGPELVISCSKAGVVGSFPTLNARTPEVLDSWLGEINAALSDESSPSVAPYAANLIVHPTNQRLQTDLDLLIKHRVGFVIASVGSPAPIVAAIKDYDGIVFSDVATVRHARRAAEAGVDGLILLCAGAGGHTGWLNPFAFVTEVRAFFDGPIVLAGAISNGHLVHVAEQLGADFAYMGTSFIATEESLASAEYRQMLIDSYADDIVLTDEITGLPSNMLKKSLEKAGFQLGKNAPPSEFKVDLELQAFKAWRDIWGAGHGTGDVRQVESVANLVARLRDEYRAALTATK